MIGTSGLSGDTLIACHFPVVQLPTWQLPVQALCSSAKRPGRLCPAGLTRAASLPEKGSSNREITLTIGRKHFSSSYGILNEDRTEEEGTSDSSGRYDLNSSPEETSSYAKKEKQGSVRLRNSFLASAELDDDEEDEDSDGDNLHRYCEDSSFVLHGNTNWRLSNGDGNDAMPDGDLDVDWANEGTRLDPDCGQDWLCTRVDSRCSPEFLSNTECVSECNSSCNSSDGILVNFCTMYNRSNNPATPLDLSSPAIQPSQPCDGSVFLNLQPVPHSSAEDIEKEDMTTNPSQNVVCSPRDLHPNLSLLSLEPLPSGLSSLEISDLTACLQSQPTLDMGTNQKYYKLVTYDLLSQTPSPAGSGLTNCQDDQDRGSPSHSSNNYKNKDQHREETQHDGDGLKNKASSSTQCSSTLDQSQPDGHQIAATSTDRAPCRNKLTASQWRPHSSKHQGDSGVFTQPSVTVDQECCTSASTERGACSSEDAVVRYSKAQRPTSLPIQPFVLSPAADKTQSRAQHLGCLLEQFMNPDSSRSSQSQQKFKGKRSRCFSNLQLSPLGSNWPPSSPDTCSTCTPSPGCFRCKNTWKHITRSQDQSPWTSRSSLDPSHCSPRLKTIQMQNKRETHSGPNQSNLVKFPTYHNLIKLLPEQTHASLEDQILLQSADHSPFSNTPPTLTVTAADAPHPNLHFLSSAPTLSPSQDKLLQHRAAPAADSGFFHSTVTAAFSSLAPLSSLSSLLSVAASGLHPQENQVSTARRGRHGQSLMSTDRPSKEFCPSPATSYESLSISHLQRRGLLRSVSRAVDLITTHFSSSRDPEEKMRLGNSSCSPTIVGLVLEHLCPTIQNILDDGLMDHKLDPIVGQCPNHSWTVVEVSTRFTICPFSRVLHSLVSKIQQCPELTNHSMRLRAFIMGLLNLRALEFWLTHLHNQKYVIAAYYHSWAFLSVSLSQCESMFEELLLILQPLSVLPFDLNLLLEPQLLRNRLLCPEEQVLRSPGPCSASLVTSWPLLQAERKTKVDPGLASIPEWAHRESDLMDNVEEGEDCSLAYAENWSQISMSSEREEAKNHSDCETPRSSACVEVEGRGQGGRRWAKLFGAAKTSDTGAQTRRRPSEWLHLDRSHFGILAQSMKSMKLVRSQSKKTKTHNEEK